MILAIVIVMALLAVVVTGAGVVTVYRVFAQLRQELEIPDVPADPVLAVAAQALVDDLARRRDLPALTVTVVPILGRPVPGGSAGQVGTGGLGLTRLHAGGRATIVLAAPAADLSEAALQALLAHELAHVERRDARRTMLTYYVCLSVLTVAVVVMTAVAASTSIAVALAGVLGLLLFTTVAAMSRREETAADLYAIELTRNLEAAAELMGLYIQARKAGRRRSRLRAFAEDRVWATHPEPEARLEAMQRHLQQL